MQTDDRHPAIRLRRVAQIPCRDERPDGETESNRNPRGGGLDRSYFETSEMRIRGRFAVMSWAIRRNDEMSIPDSPSRFAR
jgi:hypothetical protein